MSLLAISACGKSEPKPIIDERPKNKLVILGTVHTQHIQSEVYSLKILRDTIVNIRPDMVITEIPPDRFEEAMKGFQETGRVLEERVARFPEYGEVLFPLTQIMEFDIVPAAAWTRPMAEFRRNALNRLARDKSRAQDWTIYTKALERMNEKLKGREDDPFFIHTEEYDAIIKEGLTPYAILFADDLGPGAWELINQAHYKIIDEALNQKSGQGITILITYGAAHKYWFLEQIKKRSDIEILDALSFFQ